jgi:ADP-ribosylation factor-like protein 2
LRAYWRNYFEQTDGVVWVVDSADRERLFDCAKELHALLQEEVCLFETRVDFVEINGCVSVGASKQARSTKLHVA